MQPKYIAGMDFSMTCPSLSISLTSDISFKTTQFYYITKVVKHVGFFDDHITGIKEPPFKSQEERFDNISEYFLNILTKYKVEDFAIEGYSYSSTGQVFDISENTGVLKHKLFKNNINIHIFPPTEIKKFATGKGNAKKQDMFNAFLERESVDFRSSINYTKTLIDNPVSDIIDSYYILKILHKKLSF